MLSPLLFLPVELLLQVFHLLSPKDIVNVQLSCKTFYQIISVQEEALVSLYLRKHRDIRGAFEVYRCTALPTVLPRLNDLLGMMHRVDIVDNLVRILTTDILNETYRQDKSIWSKEPAKWTTYKDIINDIKPYFVLLGHFFEAFRAQFASLASKKPSLRGHKGLPSSLSSWIMRRYSPYAAIRVCLIYYDLMLKLGRKLRPPSYANAAERGLRGWTRDPAKPQDCHDIAVIGGLEGVYRIMSISGYKKRMRAMDRLLSGRYGQPQEGEHDMITIPTMPPLDRSTAKTLRTLLPPGIPYIQAHHLVGLNPNEVDLMDDNVIFYGAGFGCYVFTDGYDPKTSSKRITEEDDKLYLVANPPRHSGYLTGFDRQVSALDEDLTAALGQ